MATRTIGVAIATYNGMKFVEQQLESIRRQTHAPVLISISDDCSTDGTYEFLQRFRQRSRIPVVLSSNSRRLGVIENFMIAFRNCDAEFIAYCDQDDVWMEHKLARCSAELVREDVALVFHRSTIVDQDLKPMGRFSPANVRRGAYGFPHFPDNLWGFGHQMVFSQRVLALATRLKDSAAAPLAEIATCFDRLLLVAAGMVGEIRFIDRELMSFRRHSDCVSPAGKPGVLQLADTQVDARGYRVTEIANVLAVLAAEGTVQVLNPSQNIHKARQYLRHIITLSARYKLRRAVYESDSVLVRALAMLNLIASNSYGSMQSNKLSGKQMLIDGWRSVRGSPEGAKNELGPVQVE